MTIAEVNYTEYVSGFVGIPYKWASWDQEEGLDCRTLTVCFLRGLGYDINGEDGLDIPTEEELESIYKDTDRLKKLSDRYTRGVQSRGEQVYIEDIRNNDIVMYRTKRIPHVGVYVSNGRVLASSEKHGSILLKLSDIRDGVITVVRPERTNG